MTESTSTRDLIDRLFQQSGIKKKLAADILHVIPEIIEQGLLNDGEVRVKGLGTFRMKWTAARTGRNPKTGEPVEIPPHNRVVFLPEQSLKEFIDRDNRLLSYKVIPTEEVGGQQHVLRAEPEGSAVSGQRSEVGGQKSEDRSQKTEDSVQSSKFKVQSEDSNTRNQESGIWNLEPGTRNEEPEIDYSYEPEPEKPARKRVHWIIPTVILVIIGLSIAFYFRNFNPVLKKSEDRSQKTEDRRQKSEGRSQKSEDRRQEAYVVTKQDSSEKTEDRRQKTEDSVQSSKFKVQSEDSIARNPQPVGGQQSAVGGQQGSDTLTQNPELSTPTQNPELRTPTQDSKLKTQNSEGKHLFQLAREAYGNPFLWVLIYKANLDKIPNPDVVISGKELVIPVLEGQPRKLSHNDSVNVADGYRLVYEFYLEKGSPKAEEFHRTYLQYTPK